MHKTRAVLPILLAPESPPISLNTKLEIYPNPFSRTTSIRYSIATRAHVSLNIYDISGRLVKTFANGKVNPGRYIAEWDSRDVSSGVYFVKFKVGDDYIATKKMILVR